MKKKSLVFVKGSARMVVVKVGRSRLTRAVTVMHPKKRSCKQVRVQLLRKGRARAPDLGAPKMLTLGDRVCLKNKSRMTLALLRKSEIFRNLSKKMVQNSSAKKRGRERKSNG